MIVFIFLFNTFSITNVFSGGIESVSSNLGQGCVSSDTGASFANIEESCQKLGSSCESIFSKIGDFFKDLVSNVKQIGQKVCGQDSIFGSFFKSLLALFGIGDENSTCSSATSNETASSNATATCEKTTGQLSTGEKVTVLNQCGGKYQVKKDDGKTEWVNKKKIRVTSAEKTATTAASGDTPKGAGKVISNVQATGYFPPPAGGYKSKAEAAMEGGANDCRGNKLRTLQDYKPGSYVSCATDPRVIKTGTYFTIDEYPGVKFLACDVGGAIKGNHVDICCANEKETYKVPGKITLRYL